jgi:hypothetical protein
MSYFALSVVNLEFEHQTLESKIGTLSSAKHVMNLPKFTQILLKAMLLLAFHAFLRVGEITQSGSKTKKYYCFQLS